MNRGESRKKKKIEDKNIGFLELTEEMLEAVSGGVTPIRAKEDLDKLNRGICCKCDGNLVFKSTSPDYLAVRCQCDKCGRVFDFYIFIREWVGKFN